MVDRLRLDWLLSAAQCGEKIYCGCTCPSPSLRQRGAHYSSSQQPLPILSLGPTVSVQCIVGSTSYTLHGTWRLEGFDTGFQTGFIIYAMIWPEQRRWKFGGWHNKGSVADVRWCHGDTGQMLVVAVVCFVLMQRCGGGRAGRPV